MILLNCNLSICETSSNFSDAFLSLVLLCDSKGVHVHVLMVPNNMTAINLLMKKNSHSAESGALQMLVICRLIC